MNPTPDFVNVLILQAIRRYISDAIRSGSLVSAWTSAGEILDAYPACRLSREQVADEVMVAAARAGVAVEFGRPAPQAQAA